MDFYYSYSAWLKKRFGASVGKITINAGFSCPNRDGTLSENGCAFCDNRSFSPVAEAIDTPVVQLQKAISAAAPRFQSFIAYLQPFSNTYADVETLKAVYEPLIRVKRVVGLSIGTRPDCFSPGVFDYLGDLAQRTFLSVELGLQSSHDAILQSVNRGHTYAQFLDAGQALASRNIEIVVHCILGLPGETPAMMFQTAERLAALPVTGVKLHQLMIVAGTELERQYIEGKASVLGLESYAPLLCGFLERLRPDQVVHRIMADSTKQNGLIAPEWCLNKNEAIRFLHGYMEMNEMRQGRKLRNAGHAEAR